MFKKALEPHLPEDILIRLKMPFSVPLLSWFEGPLRGRLCDALLGESALLRESMSDSGWFRRDLLRQTMSPDQSGMRDYGASLWSLVLEAFQCHVLGARQA